MWMHKWTRYLERGGGDAEDDGGRSGRSGRNYCMVFSAWSEATRSDGGKATVARHSPHHQESTS